MTRRRLIAALVAAPGARAFAAPAQASIGDRIVRDDQLATAQAGGPPRPDHDLRARRPRRPEAAKNVDLQRAGGRLRQPERDHPLHARPISRSNECPVNSQAG